MNKAPRRSSTPSSVCQDAIDLFLEYRDEHGYDEDTAKAKACCEADGISWADWFGVQNPAADAVLLERQRQIEVEGWTPKHDDDHGGGELADAAACYAFTSSLLNSNEPPRHWPWRRESWKPCDRRQMLVKAGALILAEIERLDRVRQDEQDNHGGDYERV